MKLNIKNEKIALILGGITLILFSTKPYVLDLIEPSKSIGKIIGENAKDLIESLKGENANQSSINSKKEIWSNVITILAFISFAISIIYSINLFQSDSKKLYAIGGALLSLIGLIIYFSQLATSLMALVLIAILVVTILAFLGG